jgi:hypothetical protein
MRIRQSEEQKKREEAMRQLGAAKEENERLERELVDVRKEGDE